MIRNYLKIAWRNLLHHKGFSILNVTGLALGMVVSLLIGLWVLDELSYDRFHTNAPRIFRMNATVGDMQAAVTPTRMAPAVATQLPMIKSAVRLKSAQEVVAVGNLRFDEKQVYYADPSLLTIFSFGLEQGDPKQALSQPNGVLITRQTALRYFGTTQALGKTIRVLQPGIQANRWDELTISGVLQDIPANSHLRFDLLLPLARLFHTENYARNDAWDAFSVYTYLQVNDAINLSANSRFQLEQQVDQLYKKNISSLQAHFHLQPLTDIHLRTSTSLIQDVEGHGNIQYVRIFLVVALVILVIACINFMNLTTARSARRAKEVGLRKVVGAGQSQLIAQFLGESLLVSSLASLLAIGLGLMLVPVFNELTGKALSIQLLTSTVLLLTLGTILVTGLLAGSYPALFLSRLQPVQIISGKVAKGQANSFRNGLVMLQFTISTVLLIGTAVVYGQLRFIQQRSMGFDKENLLYVSLPKEGDLSAITQALRATLSEDPLTHNYTLVSDLPINLQTGKSNFDWAGRDPQAVIIIPDMLVDAHFRETFNMKLLAGRNFRPESEADQANYMVNEAALKLMKLDVATAIGKTLTYGNQKGQIIGVLKDFHFKPLQKAIEPLILRFNPLGGYVVVRVQPGTLPGTISRIESVFGKLYPNHSFSYSFLDEDLANLYRSEQQMGNLFNAFALFSVLISCLGLFGLAAFTAEQRTREIGVRKVLGASVTSIVTLLSTDFLKPVAVGIILAIPLAWYSVHEWLQSFAYQVSVGWWQFVLIGLLVILIALLTVSYQGIRAALLNPVQALKSDQ